MAALPHCEQIGDSSDELEPVRILIESGGVHRRRDHSKSADRLDAINLEAPRGVRVVRRAIDSSVELVAPSCEGSWTTSPVPVHFGASRARGNMYYDISNVEIHRTARRHGISLEAIVHAARYARVVVDLAPDDDPPKFLVIGPDLAGNLLEVIMIKLAEQRMLAIHAMPLRPVYFPLLMDGVD